MFLFRHDLCPFSLSKIVQIIDLLKWFSSEPVSCLVILRESVLKVHLKI